MRRRAALERQAAEYAALSPVYWALGPLLGLLPILLVGGLMVTLSAGEHWGSWAGATYLGVIGLVAGLMFMGSKLVFAEGGLWIRHYGGIFKRFIAYKDIKLVDTVQRLGKQPKAGTNIDRGNLFTIFHGVRLTLTNGKRVVVGVATEDTEIPDKTSFSIGEWGHFGGANPVARLIVGEVRSRMLAEENLPEPSPAAAELMRGDRSVEEWRAALGQRTPETHDAYRGDAGTEALWRVVEDEQAPRDARAGAAIALRAQLDESGRARLRVLADECEPKLRVAIDAALDEEAEEITVLKALERASDRTQ